MSNMDINALNWVKKEIDETLSQAGKALEVYTENQDDKAQLQFCATYIHQVYGTLQMLELYGASLLAEEMEHLARGLEAGRVIQITDAIEVLMRALIQLPDYLENLQKGQKDLPAVLLPLLNDLRAVRGYALLSENSMFTPDLSINVPDSVESRASEIDRDELSQIARKLRTLYQVALLNWYKGNESESNLQRLAEVVKRLREYSSEAFSRKLWWVSEAVIEGLLNKSLLTSVTTKLLLGQVDRQIKRLIDAGEEELQNNPDQNLVKNLLYYVAQEKTLGAVVNQVKQTYSLDSMMPKEAELKQARDGISGSNQALMNTVAIAIKEDLANVKDKIDLYLRSPEKKSEDLGAIASMLKRISDTLVMVGLGAVRNGMQEQIRYMESLLDGEAEVDEARFIEIAGVLLVVESAVDGMASGDADHVPDSPYI